MLLAWSQPGFWPVSPTPEPNACPVSSPPTTTVVCLPWHHCPCRPSQPSISSGFTASSLLPKVLPGLPGQNEPLPPCGIEWFGP